MRVSPKRWITSTQCVNLYIYPTDSAFKQQRLPAWQPVLTARTVLPTFFVIGVLFIPIGVVLLHFSNTANEYIIDYTRCKQDGGNQTCADFLKATTGGQCLCKINFTLTEDFYVSAQNSIND